MVHVLARSIYGQEYERTSWFIRLSVRMRDIMKAVIKLFCLFQPLLHLEETGVVTNRKQ